MRNKLVKMQLIMAIILMSAVTVSVYGVPSESDEILIQLHFKQGPWDSDGIGYNDWGKWHANGAFVDAGKVRDDYQMDPEPGIGMLSQYTMYGKDGELHITVTLAPWTLVYDDPKTPIPDIIKFEGTWEITGGTGEYENVQGSGTATQIVHVRIAFRSGEYMVGCQGVSNQVWLEGS
jgi:hypothetical protein